MRRFCLLGLVAAIALGGCTKKTTEVVYVTVDNTSATTPPTPPEPTRPEAPQGFEAVVQKYAEATPQEKYEANLLRASQLVGERKYAEAVEALEAAQAALKTPYAEK